MSKYEFRVKHNGLWYEPGQEVPDEKQPTVTVKASEPIKEVAKEVQTEEVTKVVTEDVVATTTEVDVKEPKSKTEIMTMKKSDLLALCKKNHLSVEMSGTEMKKALIKVYNL